MNAIDINHISKKYRKRERMYYYTLRDSLTSFLHHPFSTVKSSLISPDEFWALNDIHFSVKEGEIVGIIGQNGAGKSTLLKILSRITPPTEGKVTLRGRLGSLLEVGTGFHPELSGRENIYLNGAILGMRRSEVNALFDQIVEFAEVSEFLDSPMKHYSSGMYMRLAFAVASHLQSEILLVDEVLAVGDVEFQKKCLGKMELIAKEGRTILFVSHNMGAMQQLCNRAVWLEKGKLRMEGETAKVISSYLSLADAEQRVSLADRTRSREATLRAKIVDLKIRSSSKTEHFIESGKPFSIELTVDAAEKIHTGVWIAIKDESGHTVLLCSSGHLRSREFTFQKGVSTIACDLEPTHLTSGKYSIECGLLYPQREIIDLVPEALYFTVQHLDPYKGNFDFSQRFASVFVPHEWKENK